MQLQLRNDHAVSEKHELIDLLCTEVIIWVNLQNFILTLISPDEGDRSVRRRLRKKNLSEALYILKCPPCYFVLILLNLFYICCGFVLFVGLF